MKLAGAVIDLGGRLAAEQSQGGRGYQEDDYGVAEFSGPANSGPSHTILVLADGMGGHVGGARASATAVRTFLEAYESSSGPVSGRLRASLDAANDEIAAITESEPELNGMGCTLVGVCVSGGLVEWVSVGDSSLCLFAQDGLKRLNADHSMAPVLAHLVEIGELDAEDAKSDASRHALRSAVTGEPLDLVDQSSQPVQLAPGDRILLTSDGVETLSFDAIADVLERWRLNSPQDCAKELMDEVLAVNEPNQDNTTIMLFEPVIEDIQGRHDAAGSPSMEEPPVTVRRASIRTDSWRGPNAKKRRFMLIAIVALAVTVVVGLWAATRNASEDTGAAEPPSQSAVGGRGENPATSSAPDESQRLHP